MYNRKPNKLFHKKEKGQIVVLLAIMFIGLIAITGLAVDLGTMFVNYSRLRRSVDAAALAATTQFRENYTIAMLQNAANEFLNLNQIKVEDPAHDIQIETCDNAVIPGDPILCTTPPRKLVRVTVTEKVPLYFMTLVGLPSIPITVSAISEAATVDLVLLIDNSDSMSYEGTTPDQLDPALCNDADGGTTPATGGSLFPGDPAGSWLYPGDCHPFEEIKHSAILLVDHMFASYDRVSVVTFARFPKVEVELTADLDHVKDEIRQLRMYEGEAICPFNSSETAYDQGTGLPLFINIPEGPCRTYPSVTLDSITGAVLSTSGDFAYMWCANLDPPPSDARGCTSTNIGGGLKVAGNVLGGQYPSALADPYPGPWPTVRETALWVVVLLTDGSTNSGWANDGDSYHQNVTNSGEAICPNLYWVSGEGRYCADQDARPTLAQIAASDAAALAARHDSTSPIYDVDDYARDEVDFVTDPVDGQGALLFTIGLGTSLTKRSAYEIANNLPAQGETLLRYGADRGGGVYYPAPSSSDLDAVFLAIANKIATRLYR